MRQMRGPKGRKEEDEAENKQCRLECATPSSRKGLCWLARKLTLIFFTFSWRPCPQARAHTNYAELCFQAPGAVLCSPAWVAIVIVPLRKAGNQSARMADLLVGRIESFAVGYLIGNAHSFDWQWRKSTPWREVAPKYSVISEAQAA